MSSLTVSRSANILHCNIDSGGLQIKFRQKSLSETIKCTKFILSTVVGMGYNPCPILLVSGTSNNISLKIKGKILEMVITFKEFLSTYGKHDAIAESSYKQTRSIFF